VRRVHLFELSDLSRFPRVFRDLLTDSLQFGITTFHFYERAVPLVAKLLDHAGVNDVVDLCSGGTGPWLSLRDRLAEQGHPSVRVTFTDRHVSERARTAIKALGEPALRYDERSIEATAVPDDLDGVRTIFTGFHHLAPEEARAVLADAAERRRALGVFEFTERSALSCAIAALVPFVMLITTPFMRPLSPARFLFTYALPIVPLANLWDGLISNLRTYTEAELRELTAGIAREGYTWEIGRLCARGAAPPITYLLGLPQRGVR
jgi:hypothetical protein